MKSRSDGFALIELLIVVAVIGLLSSMLIPKFVCHIEKAQLARYISNAIHARDVLDSYAAIQAMAGDLVPALRDLAGA